MSKSDIEWTDRVWNPVTGCTKVSSGCKNCYAERFAGRAMGQWKGRDFGDVRMHPERLRLPLDWKNPQKIFVNSMSDLFHEHVPFEFIDEVFEVMRQAHWHTFQVLTKRPGRALAFFAWRKQNSVRIEGGRWLINDATPSNVWLGCSVENQKTAFERILYLLQCPAAVRFVSVEPLLSAVDLEAVKFVAAPGFFGDALQWHHRPNGAGKWPGIDWVICGGESGPGARPMHPDWARSLRDQCQNAGVPFFFKQWGEYEYMPPGRCREGDTVVWSDGSFQKLKGGEMPSDRSAFTCRRVGKRNSGRLLDGFEHSAFPAVRA